MKLYNPLILLFMFFISCEKEIVINESSVKATKSIIIEIDRLPDEPDGSSCSLRRQVILFDNYSDWVSNSNPWGIYDMESRHGKSRTIYIDSIPSKTIYIRAVLYRGCNSSWEFGHYFKYTDSLGIPEINSTSKYILENEKWEEYNPW